MSSPPFLAADVTHGMAVYDLRCENLRAPTTVDVRRPRLAWRGRDDRVGARERAFQVVVASSPSLLAAKPDLWDSGRRPGPRPLDFTYRGKRLEPGQTCYWRVRSWDAGEQPSSWSETGEWTMGLLGEPWSARWIQPPRRLANAGERAPAYYVRHGFNVRGLVRGARLYFTALGVAEPWLNGSRLTDDCLLPGWTDFRQRVQYVGLDVTALLMAGRVNCLGIVLGAGWYAGQLGFTNHTFQYGNCPALLAQIVIDYLDGSREIVGTGANWRAGRGGLRSSHLYDGESYDATVETPRWSTPAFDDAHWARCAIMRAEPPRTISSKRCGAVRRQEAIRASQVARAPSGEWIFDFGQNLVGWAALRVTARRGQAFTLRFAEMLDDHGNLYVANLRTAQATDHYVAAGKRYESWEPRFTFHGFRYVGVTGFDAQPPLDAVTAVVLHTTLPLAGEFVCSDRRINRLQENIAWSQRGNFLEVPTDCPQRDERLGWTGDAQVFVGTAMFNRDIHAFFEKWLDDLLDAQRANGAFPDVAPDILPAAANAGNAAWADAGVICPWRLYVEAGDPRLLRQCFRGMKRWIQYQRRTSFDRIRPDTAFGDWLALLGDRAETPKALIGTAYFAETTRLVSRAAAVLGERGSARALRALHREVVDAFRGTFVEPGGRIASETQTAYLLALAFDLVPAAERQRAADRLARLIVSDDYRLTTGFVGTPLLGPVLTRFGHFDVAWRMLERDQYPSWLFPVRVGATTIWERLNSYSPESGFGDAAMNSFNHYAYGAVGEWIYAALGGIAPDERFPGYELFRCEPQFPRALQWSRAWHDAPRGRISVAWERSAEGIYLDVLVPPDSRATIRLPRTHAGRVSANGVGLRRAAGVTDVQETAAGVAFLTLAGRYRFVFPAPASDVEIPAAAARPQIKKARSARPICV